jgi:hypothetical protein
MNKPFTIYGKAKVIAIRRKGGVKRIGGYTRLYPKKLSDGRIVKVKRRVGSYRRSMTGTILRLRVIRR